MPMPFDPEVEKLLELTRSLGRPPFEALTPAEARTAYAASWDFLQPPAEEVAQVRDLQIDGPGGSLALRLYRGAGTQPEQPLAALVFLHGGGWVIGNLDSHDRLCRRIANLAGISVVAVDYRLAPEHPYPAALDDARAALTWVAASADALRIDPARIAIGGDSAGGNLAAVLALMGREGLAPPTLFQALLYPAVDLVCDSASYQRVTAGVPLTAATMHWFIDHYVPSGIDRSGWMLSPLRAPSLAGLPPALVVTVGNDPLCDEGREYARRLESEGVRVTALHMGDQLHGSAMQGRQIRAGNLLVDMAGAVIRHALAAPGR
jgi:acetyl esterase